MSIAANSQIRFLHGTQSALNAMLSNGGQSGTFYLTNDTRRLYVGLDGGSIVPVNEGIVTYTSLPQATPDNAGQFAYLDGNGILAVSNGKQWVHLNPNTNTQYTLDGISGGAGTGTVTLTTQLKEAGGTTPVGKHEFKFTGTNGVIMDIVDGKVTVYGVSIAAAVVSNSEFKIQLKDKDGTESSAANIQVAGDLKVEEASGKIKITNTAAKLDGKTATVTPGSTEEGFTIKATSVDASGATSSFSGGKINPKITVDGGTTKIPFKGGVADLTKAIEDKITAAKHGFDAMTYKGTCTTLPTGSVANGDTWKASSKFTFKDASNQTVQVEVGDLIIAQGTENNGVITGTVTWEVVPSGNEDTTYTVVGSDSGITIKQHAGGDTAGAAIGSLHITAGTNIAISRSGSGNTVSLQVNHDAVSCGKSTLTGSVGGGETYNVSTETVKVVQEQTVSSTGHVTQVTTKNWTVRDTNAKLSTTLGTSVSASADATAGTSTATVGLKATLLRSNGDKNEATGNFAVKSTNKNIVVGADGTNVTVNLVWGTFGTT